MIETLREHLQELELKKARLKKIEMMLEEFEKEKKKLLRQAKSLSNELAQEEEDVKRLMKTTPTSIFYTVLGKKEEKLDKEQEEVINAQIKLRNQMLQVEELRRSINRLNEEKSTLSYVEEEYNKLMIEIKNYLKTDDMMQEKLTQAEQQIARFKNQNIEIVEAVKIGKIVLKDLDEILKSLNTASNWGIYDMLGGGMISTMMKHSHLDTAQLNAEKLQKNLRQFKTELIDVDFKGEELNFQLDSFMNIADYVFDNIFVDWTIQNSIHEFKEQVEELKEKISEVLKNLVKLKNDHLIYIAKLEKQIEDWIKNN